jgi:carboxyl-terminal processing protease
MDGGTRSHGVQRKSTTHDVAELLTRLNKENISGLVIDLRRNGGGSLEEAVNLTGLFIKKGPVVQSKSYDKRMDVLSDKDPSILYNGPMVVLTSHVSASASEIFAGALQDYNRAVIVGDKNTFGKGTVQTLLEVGRFMSPFGFKVADAGALKLTIQKFYRPSGKSTQLKGVESDVVLPSRYAHLEVGEDALKYPLPFDEVKPADFEKWSGPQPDLNDLRTRSAARVANEPEFRFLEQDIDKMESRIASNKLSLNKDEREAEIAADKKRADDIKKERADRKQAQPVEYSLTLADVDKPKLERLNFDKKDKKDKDKAAQKADAANADTVSDGSDDGLDDDVTGASAKANVVDPIKTESLNILEDMIEQQRHVKLAKTRD